jgi:uncharacterized protein involved in response to NO
VVAGFLLTAIPNWTGRLPVRGRPLMLLFALWLAGRLVTLAAATLGSLAAAVDAAFLIALAAVAWREVIGGRNMRNVPICALVSLLALANIIFHVEVAVGSVPSYSLRGGLGVVLLLIAMIGGRIVPSFTRNWMAKRNMAIMPAAFAPFDKVCLAAAGIAAATWTAAPDTVATAVLLFAAAALHAGRLLRWRGWDTVAEPLVLVLHVAYAWLPLAMALLAAGILLPGIGPSPGIHAFTAGGIGMMTLAVMTRATLGHTGRALAADKGTRWIYLLVFAGAAIRVAAPWLPFDYLSSVTVAGGLWSGGFLLFVRTYGPMLIGAPAPKP